MAARAIGTGTVSFGLVSINVKLFSTNESSSGISFNMLHNKCHSRLKQQYICPKDNEVVPRSDMVKGYEFSKDQYVVFTTEELKALEAASSQAIEISEFVPADSIDPLYYDNAYYLAPEKGGERAFRLLSEAMRHTGLHAIAKYAARGKQVMVLVRPFENGLVLQQLRWNDEVKSFSEIPVPDVELRPGELELATTFVNQLRSDGYDSTKYTDEVKARVQALIRQKVEGKEIAVQAEAPKAQIIDLMEALRASLAQPTGTPESDDGPSHKRGHG